MGAPVIVFSLDFEGRWGVADKLPDDPEAYRRNLEGELDAVHGMLDLFSRTQVGATWATVGALACAGWDEFYARLPVSSAAGRVPKTRHRAWQSLDPDGRVHFAPDAVQAIAAAPRQELASHTFSHLYFREAGVSRNEIMADCAAVARLFKERTGSAPTSFVFPRNQVDHTDLLTRAGIARWRTNPRPAFWNATRSDEQSLGVRFLRMADSLAPLGTRRAPAAEHRASYFVRFDLPDPLWALHVRRVVGESARLEPGESLHLWWHPHNLGGDVARGLCRLDELVDRLRNATPASTQFAGMEESVARP